MVISIYIICFCFIFLFAALHSKNVDQLNLDDLTFATNEELIPISKHPTKKKKAPTQSIKERGSKIIALNQQIQNEYNNEFNNSDDYFESDDYQSMDDDGINILGVYPPNTNRKKSKRKTKSKKKKSSKKKSSKKKSSKKKSSKKKKKKKKGKAKTKTTNKKKNNFTSWSTFDDSKYDLNINSDMTMQEAIDKINAFDRDKTNFNTLLEEYNNYAAEHPDELDCIDPDQMTIEKIISIIEATLCMYCGNDAIDLCNLGCSRCKGWVHTDCIEDLDEVNLDDYVCENCDL